MASLAKRVSKTCMARRKRAKVELEVDLWDVINSPRYREATSLHDLLSRSDILSVLLDMSIRIAVELDQGKK